MKQEEMRRQAELDVVLSRMRRLFEDIDTNHNGQIELGELLLLLRRVKVGDTLLESELEYFVRVLFKEIDRDGNGYLEFDELRAFLRDDILAMSDSNVNSDYDGSSDLSGTLNLRGGEYRANELFKQDSGIYSRMKRAS
uniref:EF-hand domain-containing protein n=1 Tax=Globisporangium ultimum (strain ATCC 200006 / CBS 805.95 / DAOM BR144) TaxID=431595 RepID=K3WW40_GLOUD